MGNFDPIMSGYVDSFKKYNKEEAIKYVQDFIANGGEIGNNSVLQINGSYVQKDFTTIEFKESLFDDNLKSNYNSLCLKKANGNSIYFYTLYYNTHEGHYIIR